MEEDKKKVKNNQVCLMDLTGQDGITKEDRKPILGLQMGGTKNSEE